MDKQTLADKFKATVSSQTDPSVIDNRFWILGLEVAGIPFTESVAMGRHRMTFKDGSTLQYERGYGVPQFYWV